MTRPALQIVPETWDEAFAWDDRIARLNTHEAPQLFIIEVLP